MTFLLRPLRVSTHVGSVTVGFPDSPRSLSLRLASQPCCPLGGLWCLCGLHPAVLCLHGNHTKPRVGCQPLTHSDLGVFSGVSETKKKAEKAGGYHRNLGLEKGGRLLFYNIWQVGVPTVPMLDAEAVG